MTRIIEYLKKQARTKEVVDCHRYFTNHQNRMNYAEYVKQGFAIGSGAIESTHRTLMQSRMKQAGMHWKKKNVQSIASVKARYESGRWDEMVNKYLRWRDVPASFWCPCARTEQSSRCSLLRER